MDRPLVTFWLWVANRSRGGIPSGVQCLELHYYVSWRVFV